MASTGTLLFEMTAVADHARHAAAAGEHRASFADSVDGTTPVAALWWVKDAGTYVMSNGTGDDRPAVVYARVAGSDLELRGDVTYADDPDRWDQIRAATEDICGGDDFVEVFPLTDGFDVADLEAALGDGYQWLVIEPDGEHINIAFGR